MTEPVIPPEPKVDVQLAEFLAGHYHVKCRTEVERIAKLLTGDILPTASRVTDVLATTINKEKPRFWNAFWTAIPEDIKRYGTLRHFFDAGGIITSRIPNERVLQSLKRHYAEYLSANFGDMVGYTIPTIELVEAIAKRNLPVLHIGAGKDLVGKYVATRVPFYNASDSSVKSEELSYGDVEKLDGKTAFNKYRQRFEHVAVLMCYPPTPALQIGQGNMPLEVATLMLPGDELLYVGKYRNRDNGSIVLTASPQFHDCLDEEFDRLDTVPLYKWPNGADPDLTIWRKRTQANTCG